MLCDSTIFVEFELWIKLAKTITCQNQQMGLLNVILTDSKNYYNHFKEQQQDQGEGNNKRKRKFTKDPYLNEIIK